MPPSGLVRSLSCRANTTTSPSAGHSYSKHSNGGPCGSSYSDSSVGGSYSVVGDSVSSSSTSLTCDSTGLAVRLLSTISHVSDSSSSAPLPLVLDVLPNPMTGINRVGGSLPPPKSAS